MLKPLPLTLATLCAAALLWGCSDPSPVEQVAGSYTCKTTEYSRYQTPAGVWRDTALVYKDDATVSVSAVDDNTAKVSIVSRQFGTAEFASVEVKDYGYVANLSGQGSIKKEYEVNAHGASLSGSVTYENRNIALSASVPDRGSRYTLSFTNANYTEL